MRTFRPKSWQSQARRLGDGIFRRLIEGAWEDERQVIEFFANGYNYFPMGKQRRKYVERRAAKRVYRLIRKGKNEIF